MFSTLIKAIPILIFILHGIFGIFPSDVSLAIFLLLWMVSWWVFEILPLGITALIPLFFVPMSGLDSVKSVAANYSNPIIYLFLGGFVIARALEKTRLDERIALGILSVTARSDRGIVAGFIISTAFLSMWISNTATTVMMVPIALSVLGFLESHSPEKSQDLKKMSIASFLGIAYAANIGGITTPIGTPPNVVLAGYLSDIYNIEIEFWRWLLFGLPVAATLLLIMFYLLNKVFPYNIPVGKDFRSFVGQKRKELGVTDSAQRVTIAVFTLTCALWIFKQPINLLAGASVLNDTTTAIFGGVLMFLIPTSLREKKAVLNGADISYLPWNIVMLFGGGMALASTLKNVGLIQMTTELLGLYSWPSAFVLVLTLATITLLLTEIMSNVALCIVALPVLMGLAVDQNLSPILAGLPAAICASFAFSMPISTPPNAIVFATNRIRVSEMMKVGIILNFLGIGVVMSVGWVLIGWIF